MSEIVFNQTQIHHPHFAFDWKSANLESIALKDVSVAKALRLYPQLKPLVEHLTSLVPRKRYMLLDVFHKDFSVTPSTSKGDGMHCDGRMKLEDMEHYAIWSSGTNRTIFSKKEISVPYCDVEPLGISPKRFMYFRELFGDDYKNDNAEAVYEILNECPITYTTFDFHKGRVAKEANGERFFIRLMASNHLRPGYQSRAFK